MKRPPMFAIALSILLISISQPVLADSYPANALGKLTNGITNVAFGVIEIPKTIFITSQSQALLMVQQLGF